MPKKSRRIQMLRTQELEMNVPTLEQILGKEARNNALKNSFDKVVAQYSAMCEEFQVVHDKIMGFLDADAEVPRNLLEQQKTLLSFLKGGITFNPGQLLPPESNKVITKDTGSVKGEIDEDEDDHVISDEFAELSRRAKQRTIDEMQAQFIREDDKDENTGD